MFNKWNISHINVNKLICYRKIQKTHDNFNLKRNKKINHNKE